MHRAVGVEEDARVHVEDGTVSVIEASSRMGPDELRHGDLGFRHNREQAARQFRSIVEVRKQPLAPQVQGRVQDAIRIDVSANLPKPALQPVGIGHKHIHGPCCCEGRHFERDDLFIAQIARDLPRLWVRISQAKSVVHHPGHKVVIADSCLSMQVKRLVERNAVVAKPPSEYRRCRD